jgi:hypothetical protein
MIMNTMGRRKSIWSGKNDLVFGEDRLEVRMHRVCLNYLNGMELGNNYRMAFFEEVFHSMGTNDLRAAYHDSLELMLLSLLLELHG